MRQKFTLDRRKRVLIPLISPQASSVSPRFCIDEKRGDEMRLMSPDPFELSQPHRRFKHFLVKSRFSNRQHLHE